jgi:Outer membrane lipoprotein-sorting protein
MKLHLILASTLIAVTSSVVAQEATTTAPSADQVVAKMFIRDGLRESASGGYTGHREYVLDNLLFHKRAQMVVSVNCDQSGTKHFQVISEDGWKSASKHVLKPMMETESDSSRPATRQKNRITSDNYSFRMIETSQLEGRSTYVIEATPKRQDKSLFRGRVWVDAEDYALARVEGEPAKNPSFWTKKIHFVQQYHKSGSLWFPYMTTSVTEARIFGTTDVSIRYFDYKPNSDKPTNASDPSLMEAQYARR